MAVPHILILAAAIMTQDPSPRPVSYPVLPAEAADAPGFVPRGWRLEQQARGDLNSDGRPDLALLLRASDPRNVLRGTVCGGEAFDTNPRLLAVALARPQQPRFRLLLQDHRLVPRPDNSCQVDVIDEGAIAIEGGRLRLDLFRMMSAGGWGIGTTRFLFRLEGGAVRLIGFDFSNTQRNIGCQETISINYLTRRVRMTRGYVDEEGEQVRWRRLRARPHVRLAQIGDGLLFDPDGLQAALPGCEPRD